MYRPASAAPSRLRQRGAVRATRTGLRSRSPRRDWKRARHRDRPEHLGAGRVPRRPATGPRGRGSTRRSASSCGVGTRIASGALSARFPSASRTRSGDDVHPGAGQQHGHPVEARRPGDHQVRAVAGPRGATWARGAPTIPTPASVAE